MTNHKTVIILDRCLYFNDQGVGDALKASTNVKAKSLWMYSAGAVLEYVRVVYKLFSEEKLVSIIVNDVQPTSMNNWLKSTQNVKHITNSLESKTKEFKTRKNSSAVSASLINGLSLAVKALSEPSQHQMESKKGGTEWNQNSGRIICLTSLGDKNICQLENSLQEVLTSQNKLVSNDYLLIDECHLVLVDIVPAGLNDKCFTIPKKQVSSILSSELHCSQPGPGLNSKLVELAIGNYQLAVTTVTGIPMKQDNDAIPSTNYDVELLHCKDVLKHLDKDDPESCQTNTVKLRWVTHKVSSSGIDNQSYSTYKVTPVNFKSRPALCLTKFILGGRNVMLEHVNKSGLKTLSHMLTSHNDEIFMHSLATHRCIVETPQSVVEEPERKVTDHKSEDSGISIKRPAPKSSSSTDNGEPPVKKAKKQSEKTTPQVNNDTIVSNITAALEPLPTLLKKEVLTDSELVECLKVIYRVINFETKDESAVSTEKKKQRENRYNMLWAELEKLVRQDSERSSNHAKVLECMLDSKAQETKVVKEEVKNTEKKEGKKKLVNKNNKIAETENQPNKVHPKTKKDEVLGKGNQLKQFKATTPKDDMEESGNQPGKFKTIMKNLGSRWSLHQLWAEHMKETTYKPTKKEFYGSSASVHNKFELYRNMKEDKEQENTEDVVT